MSKKFLTGSKAKTQYIEEMSHKLYMDVLKKYEDLVNYDEDWRKKEEAVIEDKEDMNEIADICRRVVNAVAKKLIW